MPKHWANLLSKTLLEAGYTQSDYDPCRYFYKDTKIGKEVYIACYVDDLLTARDQRFTDNFVRFLESKFTVRDLGEAEVFLDMEIERNRKNETIVISQRTYIKNITEKFGLLDWHANKPVGVTLYTQKLERS